MEIPLNRERIRVWLLGSRTSYGALFTVFLYLLLIAIGFVYLYPLLFMFVTSIKSPQDLLNPMVQWVPTELYLGNYVKAFRVLNYPVNLMNTILVSVAPSLIQTLVCSVIGYGLARYRFPGKHLVMGLILATFIIPPQTTVIPQMLTYRELGLLGNILSLILPATFGQGYRSAIFILIFYQTFISMPKVLEEAARLDGASDWLVFARIAVPTAIPAYVISIIFSIVWYWNETYLTVIFLEGGIQTLPMQLAKFTQAYENLYPPGMVNIFDRINEAVKMSGTFLNILPLLLMYFVMQKWFVESVERSGITGE
ncbi:carbohydrate ABC transporter permease [Anaerolinea thermophila]|uniref:ABC transporter permease protein n=1 Tax=Anaerolinea thermophila (strain DSM 14523 / JCM 11388 / NBRC 100420 / UNI-1) TaxID=926569 RepID=E8N0B0_ANATU|nr:carbohydrate ABC transporter permease [Anaerolinea thermophila]BAJ64659.1 putative ABC transporter permease protein [Anaerolinea thermophila UNI-1]